MSVDLLRQAVAGLLEAPEQSLNMTGQALEAVGNILEQMAARIDSLEQMIRGQQGGSGQAGA